jgi:hypothetical protein
MTKAQSRDTKDAAMDDIVKEGGCRCGRVRLKVTKRPLLTMAANA